MKTAFQPSFVPSRTYTHDLAGRIDEYHFTLKEWRKLHRTNLRGVQAFFIPNNAKPHQRNHYALKVYATLTEAVAAWQRQSIAARKHLAPPVRRICKFVIEGLDPRWGYQTSVASHVGRVEGCGMFGDFEDTNLARNLRKLNIAGTVDDESRYCTLRARRRLSRRDRINGDLHEQNVGFFKHRLVCIDFGTESIDFA
jgi:hypothetical protein